MEYENIHTKEIVLEEEAEEYVKEKLGIKIEPVGQFGTMTQEQMEFISEFTQWYFSGDWIKKKIENELEG